MMLRDVAPISVSAGGLTPTEPPKAATDVYSPNDYYAKNKLGAVDTLKFCL